MSKLFIFLLLFLSIIASSTANAQLYGYGVRSCDELVLSALKWEEGKETGAIDYLRMEQWLAGFVSGMSLTIGEDVTRGVELEDMVNIIVLHCQDNRNLDVFGATMTVLKSQLE